MSEEMNVSLRFLVFLVATSAISSIGRSAEVEPFRIHISDEKLANLKQRLEQARWPAPAPTDDWQYGVPRSYLEEFIEYWAHDYDWRMVETRLNQFDQFKTKIDGLDIHFMHVRSPHVGAKPLLLVHGWSGSFVEFMEVIGPLTNPTAYGGKEEDAFHLVIPSLPGFGFSQAPNEPGWSYQRMAQLMPTLMTRLGYERYGVQGGDWGAGVAIWLGINDDDRVMGIHINHPGFPAGIAPEPSVRWHGVKPEERSRQQQRLTELAKHKAYVRIQGTRPQTLAYALQDSPVGLSAWMLDKFYVWSDHEGDLDTAFSRDELITNLMIYWASGSIASSMRVYHERPTSQLDTQSFSVPIGATVFPKEIHLPPRRWFELMYGKDNVRRYTVMPHGGHFAAMEEPELLVGEVRAFFRTVQ